MGKFSEIPRHNQIDVLKKLDFKDFVKFKQCSKETVEITKNFAHRLPIKVQGIRFYEGSFTFVVAEDTKFHSFECIQEEPVRVTAEILHYSSTMSQKQFLDLQAFCEKSKLVTKLLDLGPGAKNEPAFADNLLKLLNPEVLVTWNQPSSYVIRLQELKKLKKFVFSYDFMADSDFLLLENPQIEIKANQITSSVTNQFLKQWMAGKREIEYLFLCMDGGHLEMLNDLEYFVLLSPETQESSPFAHLGEKMFGVDGEVKKIYSLRRNDGKKIFVEICKTYYASMRFIAKEYKDLEDIEKWIRENHQLG